MSSTSNPYLQNKPKIFTHNDFMSVFDNGHAIILMFIDMSAAFDTVDHDIML